MDQNVDYREMYFKMARAAERAIRLLVKTQLECEELYLKGTEEKTLTYDDLMADILEKCDPSSAYAELAEEIL